ncbi:MAG: hypothetical protein WKF79_00145 [Nocardioides sp.]
MIRPGMCRVCGCTENRPCSIPAGKASQTCGWVPNSDRTLCDNPDCVAKDEEAARS